MRKLVRDDINLLEAYHYKTPITVIIKPYIGFVLAPLISIVFCVLLHNFVIQKGLSQTSMKFTELNAELTKLNLVYDELISTPEYIEYTSLKQDYEIFSNLNEILASYPSINPEMMINLMQDYQQMGSISYNKQTHSIVTSYTANYAAYFSELITKKRATGYFEDIEYHGYSSSDVTIPSTNTSTENSNDETITQTTQRKYSATITYKLKR